MTLQYSAPAFFAVALFSLLFLFAPQAIQAQQPDSVWVRYYGEVGKSYSRDIEVVTDGFVVVGTKSLMEDNLPYPQVWLLKFNFDGEVLWTREYGDDHAQKGYAVAPTSDGGFILCGSYWTNGIPDAYVIKVGARGHLEWERVYPTEDDTFARDIKQTPDGGYVVTGATQRHAIQNRLQIDAYIMKLDADGNQEWARSYGGGWENDETWSIIVEDDGYAIAGRTWSGGAQMRDALIAKIDLDGNPVWWDIYGGEYKDHIYEFQRIPDGSGYICAGKTESFNHGFDEHGDIWILRYDPNGNFMWRSVIGHQPTEFGRSVDILPNGDFIVTGMTVTNQNQNQIFVGRADSEDGDWQWFYDFGGVGMDDAWSVRAIPGGDWVVAGNTQSMGPAEQSIVVFRMTEVPVGDPVFAR